MVRIGHDPEEARSIALAMKLAKQEVRRSRAGKSGRVTNDEALSLQDTLWNSFANGKHALKAAKSESRTSSAERAINEQSRALAALKLPSSNASDIVRSRAPSPAPSSVSSLIDDDASSNADSMGTDITRETSVGSLQELATENQRQYKCAALYLNTRLDEPNQQVMSQMAYFAARALNAPINIWVRRPGSEIADLRERYFPGTKNSAPCIDLLFNGIDHFDAFGENPPVAQDRYGVPVPAGLNTPADGNCFFHAIAEQGRYVDYESRDISEVRWMLAKDLRDRCVHEAKRLLSHESTRDEALRRLDIAGSMEIDALIEKLRSLDNSAAMASAAARESGGVDCTHFFLEALQNAREELSPWLEEGALTPAQLTAYRNIPCVSDSISDSTQQR